MIQILPLLSTLLAAPEPSWQRWQRVEVKTPDLHRFAKSPGRLWIVGKGGTILSWRHSG